nr:hypothetical protein [uncultured bacterium]
MRRLEVWSIIQSAAVVLGCAAVGASLAKVAGGESGDGPVLALGGAVVGLVAVAIGYIVRGPASALERRSGPRKLLGLRIMAVGFIFAVVGWLIAVYVSGVAGYWIAVLGVLGGGVGVLVHIVNLMAPGNR